MGILRILFTVLLAACSSLPAARPAQNALALPACFPSIDVVPGWTPVAEANTFDEQNIFTLVDGQAELFFAYGFEQVAVQRYQNPSGIQVINEIWQLANPADAYGLFTTSQSGSPAVFGNDGNSDPGRRLIFWQNRYYVAITASQAIPDVELQGFAKALSKALPTGGERPALISRLPAGGLQKQKWIFFHEEISIQNEIWLGGENLLDLSQETDGVLAHYEVEEQKLKLLLIQYPDAAKANRGLQVLRSGMVDDLGVADINGSLLAAVLGKSEQVGANKLLNAALER